VHVDAAYAGSAALLPEQRLAHFGGLDRVDSYSFNPHKWLLTTFDCCALWVADSGPLKEALSLTPVFLQVRCERAQPGAARAGNQQGGCYPQKGLGALQQALK
jgi:glutamate/tyrosine decarboxylase-like PLP-dependent enzyme